MAYSFSGGINVKKENKTNLLAAKPYAEPPVVAIPIYNCAPVVSVGDYVDIGTLIGFSAEEGACPAHASVSGTVTAIERRDGNNTVILIKNDMRHTIAKEPAGVTKPLESLSTEEIISRTKNAGIADAAEGMPLYMMLREAKDKAKRVVINCTESEPWQSTCYRTVTEHTESLVKGIKLLIYALGVRKADIVIEENKKALIAKLEEHIKDKALIDIKTTTSKHPISITDRLIYTVYSKRIPLGGKPWDTGFAVFAPETAVNLYRAFSTGMPMIHKRITVSGTCIKTPQNLIVPIGTSVADIAELCGGTKKRFKRLIRGGALTGTLIDTDAVVDKYTDTLLFLGNPKVKTGSCIRCGACIEVCPVGLSPALIAAYSEKGLFDKAMDMGAEHCVGCGCCAYTCPAGLPLLTHINEAKKEEE